MHCNVKSNGTYSSIGYKTSSPLRCVTNVGSPAHAGKVYARTMEGNAVERIIYVARVITVKRCN